MCFFLFSFFSLYLISLWFSFFFPISHNYGYEILLRLPCILLATTNKQWKCRKAVLPEQPSVADHFAFSL